jgi:hypothetical protein
MGAILGIAAYGRTQEKMAGANNGGLQLPTTSTPSSFGAPAPRAYTPAPSFGNAPLGGNTMSSSGSFGRAPIQPDHPEI